MRVCLMIEGQEDVTWDQWLALAGACEEHGLEGLFRSDHYQSVFDLSGRGSLDAWATLAALAGDELRQRVRAARELERDRVEQLGALMCG